MTKTPSNTLKKIGNEDSYTPEFFKELYEKTKLKSQSNKFVLKRTVMLATQAYVRNYSNHVRKLPSHGIKKELKKSLNNIDKAAASLAKVYTSGHYSEAVINNLFDLYPIH